METKQYLTLEVKKNDSTFVFQMPSGATWGSAIDSAFEILQKLNELSLQSVQSLKQESTEQELVEPEVCSQEGE